MTMENLTLGFDETCPCQRPFRFLEDEEDGEETEEVLLWEVLYTCGVLLSMLIALLSDRIGADSVMLVALTLFMAAEIITVKEGLAGFANEGLLTVLALFVVADGIAKTGALDWYMSKLLGRPMNTPAAQLRLMCPIAIISAFLNNTPVVVVMIPIVQRWARNIKISAQQLLVPLSFASILGGTCTLIGTSTNLVVLGLLQEMYPDDPSAQIGLFDLGRYGVPIAMVGLTYIILASPTLLPGGKQSDSGGDGKIPIDSQEDVLLGARLTPWSPAAGRSVKRSGLRDTGGIYLVSVHRAATGNVHRAVGQDFVLQVGDILYFTGLVEGFGEFCEEHGMEVLTSESGGNGTAENTDEEPKPTNARDTDTAENTPGDPTIAAAIGKSASTPLLTVVEGEEEQCAEIPCEVGVTKKSLLQAGEKERSRSIARMIDVIRGVERDEPTGDENLKALQRRPNRSMIQDAAPKVVVTSDHEFVVVGVNARDRPGLLLDLSKGLLRLKLSLRHTEASVVGQRSISIWRCELVEAELPDLEEIWSILTALLENEHGIQAVKQGGLRVLRAVIPKTSTLIGKPASTVDFRKTYKAAIVAVQKGGRNVALSSVVFGSGDVLVLQISEDSALLKPPPADFYNLKTREGGAGNTSLSRSSSVGSFVKRITRTLSFENAQKALGLQSPTQTPIGDKPEVKPTTAADLETGKLQPDTHTNDQAAGSGSPLGADSDDEGFFFGVESSDDLGDIGYGGNEVMITNIHASLDAIQADEAAWNDLQVVFHNDDETNGEDAGREFLAAMEVALKSKLAERTVVEIGLDKLPGVFLVSVDRPTHKNTEQKPKVTVITGRVSIGDSISESKTLPTVEPIFTAIPPDAPLMEGDVLWFAGSASAVGDLRKIPGLISYESGEVEKINERVHDRRLVEAVIARRGPLVGKTVKEVRFRTRYGAAVIAVHREGKRIHDHPGKIKLHAGDVLLLEAGPTFIKRTVDTDRSFALLAEVKDSVPPRLKLFVPALVLAIAMLAVFTAGVASLLVCALVASILMVALGILSEQEARDAVNWEIFITIGCAFGIGTALENSGVAGGIANFLVSIGEAVGSGDTGLLAAVYFATFLISNVVTNNAAAALLFPIAMDAAEQTGVDKIIMSYCLMLAASASFMSPFGYTTNLLIYGPGGYKYKDFLIMGTPMQLVLWVVSILFLSMTGPNWWLSWVVTFVVFVVVVAMRSCDLSSWRSSSHNSDANKREKITPPNEQ